MHAGRPGKCEKESLWGVSGAGIRAIHLAAWLCIGLKFIRRDRVRFTGGLLPVLPDCRPDRAERVRGGAGNGCYGKSKSAQSFPLSLELILNMSYSAYVNKPKARLLWILMRAVSQI